MFDFNQKAGHIDGWLTESEGEFLYGSASHVPDDRAIVEIGSWKGRSTVCLASGSRDGRGAKVFAIDPHVGSKEHQRIYGYTDTFEEFLRNIELSGLSDVVVPVRAGSTDSAAQVPHGVAFLFVDGAHDYCSIKRDLETWFPLLDVGGRVAVHDSWQLFGPSFATARMLLFSAHVRRAMVIDTVTVLEKTERASFAERAHNVAVLIYRCAAGLTGWVRLRNSRARLARLGLARP